MFVADLENLCGWVLAAQGRFLGESNGANTPAVVFAVPAGVTVDDQGDLLVAAIR